MAGPELGAEDEQAWSLPSWSSPSGRADTPDCRERECAKCGGNRASAGASWGVRETVSEVSLKG